MPARLSTEMGIPGPYTHERMRAAFETVARAAKGHGKAMGSAAYARISSSRAGCCGSACVTWLAAPMSATSSAPAAPTWSSYASWNC